MSAADWRQAVTALAAMIHERRLVNRDRSTVTVRGSDQSGGAAAGDQR
jgi:hypothetical protein